MKYVSFCAGVEAASQAWMPLGWEAVAFSEIEPFPCAVLASRFPNVPNLGDMSKIKYDRNTHELYNDTTRIVCDGGIDLIVGGTPCQSFSVAGKRAGLEGASGLAYHYARLLGEIQPRWFVWENVPGALSSVTYGNQRDFNFLLHQFGVGGDASLGIRYDLCWRVLDTQYVRVESFPRAIPQRRRRVFVVGRLATDGGGECEVLLEQEGVRGDPPPRRIKGQGFAGGSAAGVGGADGEGRGVDLYNHKINPQNGSLMTPCTEEVAQTNAVGHENGVATKTAIGFDPAPREVLKRQFVELQTTLQSGTCPGHHNAVAIGVDTYNVALTGDAAATCSTVMGASTAAGPKVAIGIGSHVCAATLDALCCSVMYDGSSVHPSLTRKNAGGEQRMPDKENFNGIIEIEVKNFKSNLAGGDTDTAMVTGDHDSSSTDFTNLVTSKMTNLLVGYRYAVRRITPIEGERLQGFTEDNWTRPCFTPDQITDELVDQFIEIHREWAAINGKPDAKPKTRKWVREWLMKISSAECPDGPRYKAIGNSMSVNVMAWVGERIQEEEDKQKEQSK